MPPIAIITDTDASIPLEVAEKYHIVQVPITVQFGNESFRAVYDIDDAVTFARIDREGKLPTTAAPSPGQFSEAYRAAFDSGAQCILCFTVSSEISSTYSSARQACELFPGKDIRVVDTRSLCIGQGFMVLAAAEAVESGASVDEAIAVSEKTRERTHLFGALSTLKYLAMSGRVGQVTAGIAGALDVKPILTLRSGKLDMLERVRTQSKAWRRLVELCVSAVADKEIERIAFLHINAIDAVKRFESEFRAVLPCPKECLYIELTPGLSVHAGAGLVGVTFVTTR